ncbi:hypothetical protein ABZ924_30470 [Streptomyces sp. NPDC046876]|uniref:hypothetical protein n=1 Tax=Streptomyces sp. NPDC046876 TaxID=3155616 RepID=UPI0033E0666A
MARRRHAGGRRRAAPDGLVTVSHRGKLGLTDAGADPAREAGHPLPDALLAALRRRTAPAALGDLLLRDAALGAARRQFHATGRDRLLEGAPTPGDSSGPAASAVSRLVLSEMLFTVFALAGLTPRGPVETAAAAATAVGLVARIVWFGPYGRQKSASAGTIHRPSPL